MKLERWFAALNISAFGVFPYLPARCAPDPPPPPPPGCEARPCPLRVDPAAPNDGAGFTWTDPRNDVQAALDAQAAEGGGEVWILGGDFVLPPSQSSNGLDVPSNVILRGGFAGDETAPEQRNPAAPATLLAAAAGSDPLLRISGRHHIVIERFRFAEVTIHDSSVRMERVDIASGDTPPDFNGSDVALVDSSLTGTPFGIRLINARVFFDRVASAQPVYVEATSKIFVLDSRFTEHSERGSVIFLEGPALEAGSVAATIVGSEFTTGGPQSTIGGSFDAAVLVFNSSFIDAISAHVGGSYPGAAAIGCPGEVSLSTFSNFWCGNSPYPCNWATNALPNNSVFIPQFPELTQGQPVPPPEVYETGTEGIGTNCAAYPPVAPNEPLCPDAGDAALLEQSRQHVFVTVAQFDGFPFHVDLSRYASPLWWQNETTRSDGSGARDTGAPDPGQHFPTSR